MKRQPYASLNVFIMMPTLTTYKIISLCMLRFLHKKNALIAKLVLRKEINRYFETIDKRI